MINELTVDGQNPAPPRMMIIHLPLLLGFNHPRWCRSSSINSMEWIDCYYFLIETCIFTASGERCQIP